MPARASFRRPPAVVSHWEALRPKPRLSPRPRHQPPQQWTQAAGACAGRASQRSRCPSRWATMPSARWSSIPRRWLATMPSVRRSSIPRHRRLHPADAKRAEPCGQSSSLRLLRLDRAFLRRWVPAAPQPVAPRVLDQWVSVEAVFQVRGDLVGRAVARRLSATGRLSVGWHLPAAQHLSAVAVPLVGW
jgi:hypothetical protein